jgi:hypothetical protein
MIERAYLKPRIKSKFPLCLNLNFQRIEIESKLAFLVTERLQRAKGI